MKPRTIRARHLTRPVAALPAAPRFDAAVRVSGLRRWPEAGLPCTEGPRGVEAVAQWMSIACLLRERAGSPGFWLVIRLQPLQPRRRASPTCSCTQLLDLANRNAQHASVRGLWTKKWVCGGVVLRAGQHLAKETVALACRGSGQVSRGWRCPHRRLPPALRSQARDSSSARLATRTTACPPATRHRTLGTLQTLGKSTASGHHELLNEEQRSRKPFRDGRLRKTADARRRAAEKERTKSAILRSSPPPSSL